jgi:hypothetical protein
MLPMRRSGDRNAGARNRSKMVCKSTSPWVAARSNAASVPTTFNPRCRAMVTPSRSSINRRMACSSDASDIPSRSPASRWARAESGNYSIMRQEKCRGQPGWSLRVSLVLRNLTLSQVEMPAVTRGGPFLAARGPNPAGEADTKSSDTSTFSDAVTAKLRVSRTSHRHSVGWVGVGNLPSHAIKAISPFPNRRGLAASRKPSPGTQVCDYATTQAGGQRGRDFPQRAF